MIDSSPLDLFTIVVGQPSPFSPGPHGEETLAITLSYGIPVALVSLPGITEEDIASVTADPCGVALYQNDSLPGGVLLLLLGDEHSGAWTFLAPILDSESVMRTWASTPPESNVMLIVLIDSITNIVHAQRTVGLPLRLLEMVREGIRRAPAVDFDTALTEFGQLDARSVWQMGTQWRDIDDSEEFSMTKEQIRAG